MSTSSAASTSNDSGDSKGDDGEKFERNIEVMLDSVNMDIPERLSEDKDESNNELKVYDRQQAK